MLRIIYEFKAVYTKRRINALHLQARTEKKTTIALDKQIKNASETLRYAKQYDEKKKYARNYEKFVDKERYYRSHSYDLHFS